MPPEQAGYRRIDDFNGANQEGVGYYQVTQKEQAALERRQRLPASGGRAQPEQRPRHHRRAGRAHHPRQEPRDGRALPPEDGRDEVARCSREIILAGGAVNSPQLLMLSGIGPADHLKSVGIRPLLDLPGVGGNLQDHLDAAMLQFCKTRDTYDTANKLVVALQYWKDKKGPGTSPIAESAASCSTRPGLSAPDIQLHFLPVLVVDHGRTKMKKNGYSLHVCTLRPESKGTIRLPRSDPLAHPLIDANYLAERRDLDTLIEGVKIGREIFAGERLRSLSRRRVPARRRGEDRRRDRAVDPRHVRDDLSPGRHLQDGPGQRSDGGRRPPAAACTASQGCAWSTPR